MIIVGVLSVLVILLAIYLGRRRKNGQQNITIVNQQPGTQQQVDDGEENLEAEGRIDEKILSRMFGLGRRIKEAAIGISIAIPFLFVGYLITENLAIIMVLFVIFIVFGYFWANHWVKPEGVQLILDGDLVPGDPKQGVQHADIIVPYEQWKYLMFTDPSGANPIKTPTGLAYRAEDIEFWDENQKVVKSVKLAWMHSPHSNFEQEHELNHRLATWVKVLLKKVNLYEKAKDIIAILEAKQVTETRERVKLNARSSPIKSKADLDEILKEIDETEKEEKRVLRTGKETSEKPDESKEVSSNAGEQ